MPGTGGKDRLFCYNSPLSLLDQQNLPESLLRPGLHRSSSREMKLISHADLGYKPLSPRTPTTDFGTNYGRGHPPPHYQGQRGALSWGWKPRGTKQDGRISSYACRHRTRADPLPVQPNQTHSRESTPSWQSQSESVRAGGAPYGEPQRCRHRAFRAGGTRQAGGHRGSSEPQR